MSIIVIALDENRAKILSAGLELSGYQNNVITVNTADSLLNEIAQDTPELLIVDYSLSTNDDLLLAIQSLSGIPVITIGESEINADVNLSFPYQFHDFLPHVYRLAPIAGDDLQPHFVSSEESEAKYRDLFDRASDGIFLIDLDTHIIIDVNKQVETIYGYALDEIIGMSLLQIVPHDEHPAMLNNTRKMRGEERILRVANRTHIKKDGSLIPVSISASLIEYGGRIVFQDIVRDETERIRQETELKRLNEVKDEFVSNISHELRTPLSSLNLRLHLLKKSPDGLERHISTIEREINRLEALIENLLILSRIDQGREVFLFSKVDVNEIVQQYYLDRKPLAEDADLTLTRETTSSPLYVYASHDLLGQVLSILLTNAINYTPAGGQITLGTDVIELEGEQWAQINVSDTGIGILSTEQESLFTRFFRGKVGRDSKKSGTGLGLAIAKEMVNHHNGRITVDSEGIPGKGTTFSICLPLML